MELAAGRTIKWKFEDGPMAGVEVEHDLNADGSITWRIADGPHKGTAVREKQYDAHRVSENVWTLSYLAASGHTLTAVLNFTDGRVIAYGSDNVTWTPNHGRFEIVR